MTKKEKVDPLRVHRISQDVDGSPEEAKNSTVRKYKIIFMKGAATMK
jgi:hypothetical protein